VPRRLVALGMCNHRVCHWINLLSHVNQLDVGVLKDLLSNRAFNDVVMRALVNRAFENLACSVLYCGWGKNLIRIQECMRVLYGRALLMKACQYPPLISGSSSPAE